MILSLIAAVSENNVIGRGGQLPWRLPDDLKHFKELTAGKSVIMGRKTFESIGRPLPGRHNIVITRQRDWSAPGCNVAHSLDEALQVAIDYELPIRPVSTPSTRRRGELTAEWQTTDSEVFIIGGSEIYREALPRADRLYLTCVHAVIGGDAFFPEVDLSNWRETSRERHHADDRHAYPYTFFTYEKI